MNLTIDLSEQNAAALEAQARAARMPAERYLAQIVARALERQHRRDAENLAKHLDYMASQVAPETSAEEMEAALQEALTHARPRRNWQPSLALMSLAHHPTAAVGTRRAQSRADANLVRALARVRCQDRGMVVHNEAESRFELKLGAEIAVLEYRRTADSMVFTHTGVPPEFEGRGYGGQLARAGLDYAREAGLKIVPQCSFIAEYIRRNPEYLESVAEPYRGAAPSCRIRR